MINGDRVLRPHNLCWRLEFVSRPVRAIGGFDTPGGTVGFMPFVHFVHIDRVCLVLGIGMTVRLGCSIDNRAFGPGTSGTSLVRKIWSCMTRLGFVQR